MEKRVQRRYPLNLYTCLRVEGAWTSAASMTRDISSEGAYLHLDTPLPVGTRTSMTVSFRTSFQADDSPPRLCGVQLMGTVLRSEEKGMAVRFDRKLDFIEQQLEPVGEAANGR